MAKPRPIPSPSVPPPFTRRLLSPTVHSAAPITHRSHGGSHHPPFARRLPSPTIHLDLPPHIRAVRLDLQSSRGSAFAMLLHDSATSFLLHVFWHCKHLYSRWSDCKSDQTEGRPWHVWVSVADRGDCHGKICVCRYNNYHAFTSWRSSEKKRYQTCVSAQILLFIF